MYLNLYQFTPDQIEKEARVKSLKPFFSYREVPALALSPYHLPLHKKPTSSSSTNRGVPALGVIDQPPLIPAAVNKGSLRWHHRPATPRLTAPARHRRRFQTLGGPEWTPSPPWRFTLLALRPPGAPLRRQGHLPVIRGAQPVGLLDKAVKTNPRKMPMTLRSKPEPSAETPETTPTEPPVEAPTEEPPAREEPPIAIPPIAISQIATQPISTPQIATPPITTPPIATTPFATQPPSTATMTSESSQMVQLMAAMMELLQRNAALIAATQPQPPAPVYHPEELLRMFAGEPQDDPEVFITEVEAYFQQVGECKLTPRHRLLVAHRQLRGDVAKQNKYYRDEDASVEELWVRLRRDYGTETQFTRLLTAFTGATFRQNEPLGEFVSRQSKLYRRLFPGSPESRIVRELVQQMPSSVRSILAVGKYNSIADFVETATNVISWAGADEKKKKASENWRRAAVTSPTQPDASS
jgi:hypothetical protein